MLMLMLLLMHCPHLWSILVACGCLFCVVVEESSSVSVKVATCCSTAATLGLKSAVSATESSGVRPPLLSSVEPTEGLELAAGN